MELVWSPAALEDLSAAVDYIEFDLGSPKAAQHLLDSVLEKAELAACVPGAGTVLRTVRGIDSGYRYVVCGNWMVFFECGQGRILVVRILYAKSDYMKTLFGEVGD